MSIKKLKENIFTLGILQISNYVLPLITIPYLLRVIGIENFGLLGFATAFVAYFVLFVDYGFNLSATRDIAANRCNQKRINEIFSSVMTLQVGLSVLGLSVMMVMVFTIEALRENYFLYIATYGMIFGKALFPVWLYQGFENMKYVVVLNIVIKLFFVICIFLFVDSEGDYILVPMFTSLGFILIGFYSITTVPKVFGVSYKFPGFLNLKEDLEKGWHIFLSRLYVNLYTTTNIVLLGFISGPIAVGVYLIGYKIASSLSGLFSPVFQALYPYLTKEHVKSTSKFDRLFDLSNLVVISLSTLMGIIIYIFSDNLVELIAGGESPGSVLILKILSVFVVIAPFGSSFTNYLLIKQRDYLLSKRILLAVIVNMALAGPAIWFFGSLGLASVVLLVQFFIVGRLGSDVYQIRQREVIER
jgi:polysaccharide transporter, PST family